MEFCNSSIENLSISLDLSIELTLKLDFRVSGIKDFLNDDDISLSHGLASYSFQD